MRDSDVPVKTDAGRDEIQTRARKLPTVMRSILLVVDGQRDVAELKEMVRGLHGPADALAQLQAMGLITGLGPISFASYNASSSASPLATPGRVTGERPAAGTATGQTTGEYPLPAAANTTTGERAVFPVPGTVTGERRAVPETGRVTGERPAPAQWPPSMPAAMPPAQAEPQHSAPAQAAPATPVPAELADRYQALYQLMSDTVREHLGLRGYFLQLKIERCTNSEELAELLPDLYAALAKARNVSIAEAIDARLRALADG